MLMDDQILDYLRRPDYTPVAASALQRLIKDGRSDPDAFYAAIERLKEGGRIRETHKGVIRPLSTAGMLVGTVRRSPSGVGMFFPHDPPEWLREGGIHIAARDMGGAHRGDEVLVRLLARRKSGGQRCGRVEEILQRATHKFVGTYFERDRQGFVAIDGTAFPDPLPVGDPGAKGARPKDKVVVEMLQFPTTSLPGEAVLTEVLGPRGAPGVDTLSIIHEFGLPEEFSDSQLQEARLAAENFDEQDLGDRRDLTKETIVTIDPADARDFDDAISLRLARNGHWHLGVHIADVSHFVTPGSELDVEARSRGNSVYLPDRVIPMLPELLSNGLASLQQGKMRFTKSVFIEYTAEGIPVHTEFCNSAISVTRRFAYEDVLPIIQQPKKFEGTVSAKVRGLLLRMHDLAMLLRKRRFDAGSLNLDLPEVKLDLDADGRVTGAHETVHDESHQIIEEFMLAANVAVATKLADRGLPFLRRVHPDPSERKLRAFAEFVDAVGFRLKRYQSRKDLQDLIDQVRGKPAEQAVNYALLRSLKQAEYSAVDLGHYALAVDDYCHFTSPIRRYPDLTVHRLINGLLTRKKRPPETDETIVERMGKHCSFTERRAANAERELIRVKLLNFMASRIGEKYEAIVTGVESFGMFCRGTEIPVEGMLHISALDPNEFFDFDRGAMTLTGRRRGRTYRLGDRVHVEVVRVDVNRRELDLRLADAKRQAGSASPPTGTGSPSREERRLRPGRAKKQTGNRRGRRRR
jgi:ribonuclease R